MKSLRFFLFPLTIVASAITQGADHEKGAVQSLPGNLPTLSEDTSAEKKIDLPEIYPMNIGEGKHDVLPVNGMPVDENPPFLFCSPTVASKTDYEYVFRLSQDPQLQQGVIESSARRWTFYSPYQPLALGVWHWQFGYRPLGSSTPLTWSDVFSFKVSDEAWTNRTPPFSTFAHALDKNPLPRVICKPGELGNLWPVDAVLKKELMELIPTKAKIPVVLPSPKSPLPDGFNRVYVSPYLTSYVLTQDPKYVVELKKGIDYILDNDTEAEKASFFFETTTPVCYYYELFRDQLPEAERNQIHQWLRAPLLKAYLKRVNFLERYTLNEHDWQSDVPAMLTMATVLYDNQDPQVAEVLEWLYDLWHFRGPVGERNSGSWASHGYFQTHSKELFRIPFIFTRHTGHNHFDIPWFKNYPRYEAYLAMPGSNDIWGDGNPNNPGLAEILHLYQPDRYSQLFWNTTSHPMNARFMLEMPLVDWFALPALSKAPLPNRNNPSVPIEPITSGGTIFRDGGFVALSSNPSDPANNVKVWMRSSPYGLMGHGHPGNNAFTISRGGQPIFVGTGFYSSSGDYFSMRNYKHTRAKNSILPRGNVCEGLDSSGYGWMPRMLSGRKISYCLGDASNAFSGKFTRHAANLANSKLAYTPEDGYINPGVTRWRRHLVLLENGTVVVYDELEAREPIAWTYTLNNVKPLEVLTGGRILSTPGSTACVAQLFSTEPLFTNVTDQWFGDDQAALRKAMNFKNPNNYETKRNWHATLAVNTPVQKLRFLNVIRNAPSGAETPPCAEQITADGHKLVTADGWSIEVELDGSKPSLLRIRNDDGTAALITGQTAQMLQLGDTVKRTDLPGTTILMEMSPGKTIPDVQTAVDVLPDAVRFGNLY